MTNQTNPRDAPASREQWQELLDYYAARRHPSTSAYTFLKKWGTGSGPVQLLCDDGHEYIVKGGQTGKIAINDQIAGRLAEALGAPMVGQVRLVEVPAALVASEPEMAHMRPGICHGSLWIRNCTDAMQVDHADETENRHRFALLAILYGWICAGDRQFVYQKNPPRLVFSVDHGNFFPGGPNWTLATLQGAPPSEPDTMLVTNAKLTEPELRSACHELEGIDSRVVAAAVAAPPDDWGISLDERLAVAEYLARRRLELLARY